MPFFNASFPARNIICGTAAIKSPRIPHDYIILDNWVFENFILANEPFAKVLQIFETYVSVTNNFCGILVSSLELSIKFDGRFKVTSVPFFTKTK